MIFILALCFALTWTTHGVDQPYTLQVKTSNWAFAGTDEIVGIRLMGDKANSDWLEVNGDPDKSDKDYFERNHLDTFNFMAKDIGQLLDIEVRLTQQGWYLNKWKMDWIILNTGEMEFKAYYWKVFLNSRTVKAESIDILSCQRGYEHTKISHSKFNHKCTDIDECETSCKGQGTSCKNLPGSFSCTCLAGYEYSGSQCIDVNECIKGDAGNLCSGNENTHCWNTVGSYTCQCNDGFKKSANSDQCEDIDECKTSVSNCAHTCVNNIGSFKCACNAGYRLAPDGYSCVDANDCAPDKNPCDPKTTECFDVVGGYSCFCKYGYKKQGQNNTSCEPVTCRAIALGNKLRVTPSRCLQNDGSKKGEQCHFSCEPGYQLHQNGANSTECSASGLWKIVGQNLDVPICVPTKCDPLPNLENGYVLPSVCTESGIQHNNHCQFYCKQGFVLEGDHVLKCSDRKFSPSGAAWKKPVCYKVPSIECPKDVTISLPRDKMTVSLGENFRGPKTNMKPEEIYSYPKDLSENYEFGVGTHYIRLTASNSIGLEASCQFLVTVQDNTPPIVEFCPQVVKYQVDSIDKIFVEWPEPRFVDNVAIKEIRASSENKKAYSPSTFNVMYEAIDTNKNIARCEFKVEIEILDCNSDKIIGGDNTTRFCTQGGICIINCKDPASQVLNEVRLNKMFGINSFFCIKGKFYHDRQDTEALSRLPSCVDYVQLSADKTCPVGSLKTARNVADIVCGKCPKGTHYQVNKNHPTGTCVECPSHYYQDEEGRSECKKCPKGTGHIGVRSVDVNSCTAFCPAGTYSTTGFPERPTPTDNGCRQCPFDTYSSQPGSIQSCTPCPPGKITEEKGSLNMSQCIDIPIEVFLVPGKEVVGQVGNTLKLKCFASSKVAPKLAWTTPCDLSISPGSSHSVEVATDPQNPEAVGVEYIIGKAQESDSGIYTCKVTNSMGSLRNLQVKVLILPTPKSQ